jgi:hypothetical protein
MKLSGIIFSTTIGTILAITNVALGGDYYVKQVSTIQQQAIINKPQVFNRFISLTAQQTPEYDITGELAEARALEIALSAVKQGNIQPAQWRQFRFRQNTPDHTELVKARSSVQTRTVQKSLIGIADMSFKIDEHGRVQLGY